jgi:hypothetical protein
MRGLSPHSHWPQAPGFCWQKSLKPPLEGVVVPVPPEGVVVPPEGVPPVGEAGVDDVVVGAADVVGVVVVGVVVVPVVVVDVVAGGARADASRGTVRSGVDLGTESVSALFPPQAPSAPPLSAAKARTSAARRELMKRLRTAGAVPSGARSAGSR